MMLRFPFRDNFRQKLNSYKGTFKGLCYPNQKSNETKCYVILDDDNAFEFIDHFVGGEKLEEDDFLTEDSTEWPLHPYNFAENINRAWLFSYVEPRN